jgi:predicted dehydrogenase
VGCGKIAGLFDTPSSKGGIATHARAYHSHPDFQLSAVVDTNADSLTKFQQVWDVPRVYTSPGELCESEWLDVVSVCSPDRFHYQQSIDLLKSQARPKVLLIEKPVCTEPEQLERLRSLASECGTTVAVNHTRRYDPAHREAAHLIQSGMFGRLVSGRCDYYGGWLHNATHVVDTLRMLLNDEPTVISSKVSGTGKPGDEDLDVTLLFGGAEVRIEAFDERHYQLFQSELRFERGIVRLLDFGTHISIEQVEVNKIGERVLIPSACSPLRGLESPMYHTVQAVHSYLSGNDVLARLGVDLNSAANTMNIMWRARELAVQGLELPKPVSDPG